MTDILTRQQAILSEGKKVLDWGYAFRPNIFFKRKGIRAHGYDIQKTENTKELRENYCKTRQLNADEWNAEKNKWDTIILGSILEHVENPSRLLRQCNKGLKNKGKLIVTIPHANDPWTTIHNWFLPFIPDQDRGEHLSNWSKKDIIRLLKKNGFETMQIHSTVFTMPALHFEIPLPNWLHMLCWAITLECKKITKADERIYCQKEDGTEINIKNNI